MPSAAQAAAALANVCASSTEIQSSIASEGAVAPLVAMLEEEREVTGIPCHTSSESSDACAVCVAAAHIIESAPAGVN